MFRIDNSPSFKAPITFTQPGTDGKRHAHTFMGVFKRVKQDYVDAALGDDSEKTVDQLVAEVFIGFEDVQDADGKAMESTAENIATLLQLPGMCNAVFAAFFAAHKQGAEKN